MRATNAKIKRILEKDYSNATIKQGQEWYVGEGIFLECHETKEHLLYSMEFLKDAVKSVQSLRNVIDGELGEYRISNDLFGNVLDLGEHLAIIESYAEEYIHAFHRVATPDADLKRRILEADDTTFSAIDMDECDDDEVLF